MRELVFGGWGLLCVVAGLLCGRYVWPCRRWLDDAWEEGRADAVAEVRAVPAADDARREARESAGRYRGQVDLGPSDLDTGGAVAPQLRGGVEVGAASVEARWAAIAVRDMDEPGEVMPVETAPSAEMHMHGVSIEASENVARPDSTAHRGTRPLEARPGHPDWREQVEADLAPRALAAQDPRPGEDVPDASSGRLRSGDPAAGPGLDPHWYANGLHYLADWQAEWHADAAAIDSWLPGYLADNGAGPWSRGGCGRPASWRRQHERSQPASRAV